MMTRLLIKKIETGRPMRKRTKHQLYSCIVTTVDSFEPQTPPEEQAKQQLQTFIHAESPRIVVSKFINRLQKKGYYNQ
jgi:hypothetical protein